MKKRVTRCVHGIRKLDVQPNAKPVRTLAEVRRWIDEHVEALVALANKRQRCAIEAWNIKSRRRLPLYDRGREARLYRLAIAANRGPLSDAAVRRIVAAILDESHRLIRRRTGAASEHFCAKRKASRPWPADLCTYCGPPTPPEE